jgi:hypothetical protein
MYQQTVVGMVRRIGSSHSDLGETVLTGVVADQAALYGIISRLRDLGLQLTSVSSKEIEEDSHEHKQ